MSILISTGNLTRQALGGQVAVITGAGGGIGFEAARALVWLGAKAVIAEIDPKKGKTAEKALASEFGTGNALFILTDIGDERSVFALERQVLKTFGKVDIVLNNATYAPLGSVLERAITDWDKSYRANLRGPVLLAQAFLPGMIERNKGTFVCVSSVGGAYMGTYETLKTAQVELARTLDGELEGKDINVFTIGPGLVPTETMVAGVAQIASRYGKTPEEFYATYQEQWLSVEAAGTGFAA
jgi:NAD(P)-dependent dehydrogenase (short-subunit alcohol dehydrogenase family)